MVALSFIVYRHHAYREYHVVTWHCADTFKTCSNQPSTCHWRIRRNHAQTFANDFSLSTFYHTKSGYFLISVSAPSSSTFQHHPASHNLMIPQQFSNDSPMIHPWLSEFTNINHGTLGCWVSLDIFTPQLLLIAALPWIGQHGPHGRSYKDETEWGSMGDLDGLSKITSKMDHFGVAPLFLHTFMIFHRKNPNPMSRQPHHCRSSMILDSRWPQFFSNTDMHRPEDPQVSAGSLDPVLRIWVGVSVQHSDVVAAVSR